MEVENKQKAEIYKVGKTKPKRSKPLLYYRIINFGDLVGRIWMERVGSFLTNSQHHGGCKTHGMWIRPPDSPGRLRDQDPLNNRWVKAETRRARTHSTVGMCEAY